MKECKVCCDTHTHTRTRRHCRLLAFDIRLGLSTVMTRGALCRLINGVHARM